MTAREKAIEIVADIQGWKREDYERPRDEITRMHGGAEFNLLTEAIERALLDTIEECARVAESEPELPGPIPAELKDFPNEELARAVVGVTIRNIAAEIRKMGAGK